MIKLLFCLFVCLFFLVGEGGRARGGGGGGGGVGWRRNFESPFKEHHFIYILDFSRQPHYHAMFSTVAIWFSMFQLPEGRTDFKVVLKILILMLIDWLITRCSSVAERLSSPC